MTTPSPINPSQSPYDRHAYLYLERGYCVIPIAPGTKRPGTWSEADGWRGMHDWERYHERLPSPLELSFWEKWPGAGIGLLTGKLSRVVALDRDYDAPGTDALEKIIPWTPVKKKGAKGYTAFFRYNGERSCSFNIGQARVLDVLSDGRQTLMPGTLHPDGHTYVYLTEDRLEDYEVEDLPQLPDDFLERVAQVLAPFQTDEDKKYQRRTHAAPAESGERIDTSLSAQGQYYRDINTAALAQLDTWVERLVPHSKPEREGYRTIATWRGAKNPNVGIHPDGIFDFGGNYGMTPIDLVMYANQIPMGKAVDALRACVRLATEFADFTGMTVNGLPMQEAIRAAGTPPVVPMAQGEPMLMPWQRPTAIQQAPAPVMLPPTTSVDPAPAVPSFISNPPGMLATIARWITDTAPKAQPELALAAAICLASVVMGRTYCTQFGQFTGLYFIMIAKSTEGKEHPQACIERALADAGLHSLNAGSGYTSPAAVFSALLRAPAHIVTIDEIGKYLKASRAKGNVNAEGTIDKLVEAFGRQGGVMYPQTYSTMTAKRGEKLGINAEAVVRNPCITLLGATTPATFYDNLTDDLVKDGFLGRCIVVESKQPRQLIRMVPRDPPPGVVVDWIKAVHYTGVFVGDLVGAAAPMPDVAPRLIELPFSPACQPLLKAFAMEMLESMTANEAGGMDVLLGRTYEKAAKLSLIACKAESPANREILPHHVAWAINYARYYDMAMVRAVHEQRTENEHDQQMKKLVGYVRDAKKFVGDKAFAAHLAQGLMPKSKLLKLMKMKARALDELLDTAVQAKYILKSPDELVMDVYLIAPE